MDGQSGWMGEEESGGSWAARRGALGEDAENVSRPSLASLWSPAQGGHSTGIVDPGIPPEQPHSGPGGPDGHEGL